MACALAMLSDLLIPLITVGLAELGDKTQLSILLLTSKTKGHFHLLLGVLLAFLLVNGVAVAAGSWITYLLPRRWLEISSGIVFIIFGALMLRGLKIEEERVGNGKFKNTFLTGFSLIFLTEWGDKTQIASALLATKYDPSMVFMGAIIALTALSITAIYLGKGILNRMDRKTMMKLSGIIFIIIGLYIIFL